MKHVSGRNVATRRLEIFFFQAVDGIRDLSVTGVQTCALPISGARSRTSARSPRRRISSRDARVTGHVEPARRHQRAQAQEQLARLETERSEERRVGKECRCRVTRSNRTKNCDKERHETCERQECRYSSA